MKSYDPKKIEKKWQKRWEKEKLFATPSETTREDKYYILPQLPYPSGSGLHVGHAEVYAACDIYARYKRMTGKKVLQVIGWDAFGLPAENYAIKTNVHPRKSTDQAIDMFRRQIQLLGVSVDWSREVGSHNPDYYKWTQWFFLLFYKRGLAYRKKQAVNWCDSCKTVLANEQVTGDGKCERCDTVVEQKEMEQWYLKITDYADRLLEDLDKLDWPEETKKRQKDWIGRSEGAEVQFTVIARSETTKQSRGIAASSASQSPRDDNSITVFTTRPDTLFGSSFMVLAPEHLLVQNLKNKIENWKEVEQYIEQTKLKTDLDRQTQKEKTGVELKGIKAINPANQKEISIFIADYVLATYGFGAIMAVPAHDERDFEFAQKNDLPITQVVSPVIPSEAEGSLRPMCFTGEGVAINSDFINGLTTEKAIEKMNEWLEEENIGKRKIQYRLRDWSISRQRFWGAPIPVLYDEKGELHPIPEEDLPVILPDDVDFKPTGESPLNYSKSFNKGVEKKYGQGWRREPDTLDTFMCSSWYYFRYLDPHNDKAFASPDALKTWMPVDFYLGGPEHVNSHLLYSRFFTKVLFDAGYINFDEPFLVHRHQGMILGEDNHKMSKRWGNAVNPTDVINEFGADTLRAYEMFMGPLEADKPWDTNGVKGVRRFLERVWHLQEKISVAHVMPEKMTRIMHQTIKKATHNIESMRFNTAIAKMMELINEISKENKITPEYYGLLILILSPFAPHMCEEIWQTLGHKKSLALEAWPEYSEELAKDSEITLAVQINGKLRDTLEVSADITETEAKDMAVASEKVKKWLEGKEPKKVIYVKGKLVSIVV
ncbi:MAG: leucine--tRNA ligase [Candidatus Magasanikbacteria bacterium]|nr:leucine--tRNA ligase [Candidatus Magasanikbacteria bacterium]